MDPAVNRLLPPDSSSGAASSISTDAPCSCAASAAQNAALPPPTTMTSASDFAISPLTRYLRLVGADLRREGRGVSDAAMGLRPARRVMHEFFDLGELCGIELAARLGDRKHVPPGRQRVQRHAEIAQDFPRLGKNVVEEENQRVLDLGPGLAQRGAEIDLAAAVAGHVLDQQHALPFDQMTFDLAVAPESFGLLAHIEHRQSEPVGHPGGERNAGGLPASNRVELLEPGL